MTGPRLQNELLTILETEDLSHSPNRYVMAVSVKALMLFPSRWFSPVLWGLAFKGEKVVQVSQPIQSLVS